MKYWKLYTYCELDSIQSATSIYKAAEEGGVFETDWGQEILADGSRDDTEYRAIKAISALRKRRIKAKPDGKVEIGTRKSDGWFFWRYVLAVGKDYLSEEMIRRAEVLRTAHEHQAGGVERIRSQELPQHDEGELEAYGSIANRRHIDPAPPSDLNQDTSEVYSAGSVGQLPAVHVADSSAGKVSRLAQTDDVVDAHPPESFENIGKHKRAGYSLALSIIALIAIIAVVVLGISNYQKDQNLKLKDQEIKEQEEYIQQMEAAFDLDPDQRYRIGVLRCVRKAGIFLHEDLITRTLGAPKFDVIQAEEFDTHPASLQFCEKPSLEELAAAHSALGADLFVWGKVTEDTSDAPDSAAFTWNGFVFRDGLERAVTAQGSTATMMADNVSKAIHHLLYGQSFVSHSSDLYSIAYNVKATAFFVQADIYSRRGKHQTATDLFTTVVEEEPEYFAAIIKLGHNLYVTGRLDDAEARLAPLLNAPDFRLPPVFELEIYRTLALIYYQRSEPEAFIQAVKQAQRIAETDDTFLDDYLFFLQLEAKFMATRGEGKQAMELVGRTFQLAHEKASPRAQVENLLFMSRLKQWKGDWSDAIAYLDQAESLANDNHLPQELVKIAHKRLEFYWNTNIEAEAYSKLLVRGYEMAKKSGYLPDTVWVNYWEGMHRIKIGDRENGLEILKSTYLDAKTLGHRDLVMRSGYYYGRYLLTGKSTGAAEIFLREFDQNTDKLSTRHQIWIQSLWLRIHFIKKQFSEALVVNEKCLNLSKRLGQKSYIERDLNNRGEILEHLGRVREAEAAYLESIKLKNTVPEHDATGTMKNLIRLYSALGELDKAAKIERQLRGQ